MKEGWILDWFDEKARNIRKMNPFRRKLDDDDENLDQSSKRSEPSEFDDPSPGFVNRLSGWFSAGKDKIKGMLPGNK